MIPVLLEPQLSSIERRWSLRSSWSWFLLVLRQVIRWMSNSNLATSLTYVKKVRGSTHA